MNRVVFGQGSRTIINDFCDFYQFQYVIVMKVYNSLTSSLKVEFATKILDWGLMVKFFLHQLTFSSWESHYCTKPAN